MDERGWPARTPVAIWAWPVRLAVPSGSDRQYAGFPRLTCQVTLLSMR